MTFTRYERCAMCGGIPIMSRSKVECPRCGISVTYGEALVRPIDTWRMLQTTIQEARP